MAGFGRVGFGNGFATREVPYSAGAEKAVEIAGRDGWTVISMKTDWKRVFTFQGA